MNIGLLIVVVLIWAIALYLNSATKKPSVKRSRNDILNETKSVASDTGNWRIQKRPLRKGGIGSRKLLVAGVVALAVSVWATWPGSWVLNSSCEPKTVFAQISETIYGRYFWEEQLQNARDQAVTAEKLVDDVAKTFSGGQVEKYDTELENIYAKHPELAPTPGERAAQRYRDLADQIEAREAYNQELSLVQKMATDIRHCERTIAQSLGVPD